MFVRFVRLSIHQDRLAEIRQFYAERVVPALAAVNGCVFASLLEPSREGGEALSVTLWSSQAAAEAYEASGVYDELLDEADPLLVAPSNWVRELGTGQSGSIVLPDPTVEGYLVGREDGVTTPEEPARPIFVRMVAMRVGSGRLEELRRRYDAQVSPVLRATPGCRDAFLLASLGGRSRVLSVTFWDREEDAVRYELSGSFDRLVEVLRDCLSEVEQWRLSLAARPGGVPVARRGLEIAGFRVVTARRLHRGDP